MAKAEQMCFPFGKKQKKKHAAEVNIKQALLRKYDLELFKTDVTTSVMKKGFLEVSCHCSVYTGSPASLRMVATC